MYNHMIDANAESLLIDIYIYNTKMYFRINDLNKDDIIMIYFYNLSDHDLFLQSFEEISQVKRY